MRRGFQEMIRLLRHLRPYYGTAALAIALVAGQSLAQLYLPNLMATIVDQGIARNNPALIWRVGARMLLVSLVAGLAALAAGYLSAKVSAGYGRLLRELVFARASRFSLQEFDQLGTASLVVRTTNDVTQVQSAVLMGLRLMVMAPLMAVGGVIMAVSLDPTLSALLTVAVPLVLAVVLVAGSRALPLFRSAQAKLDRLNVVLRERLTGIRVIRAFDRGEHEEERFGQANWDLTDTALRVNRLMAAIMPLMMLILNLTVVGAMYLGGFRVWAGGLEVGALMAFVQYAMQILMSLLMMSMVFVMLPRASASAERILQVLDTPAAVVDPAKPVTPESRQGQVEFREVSFTYPGAQQPALQGVSFLARPGQVTAVIGGTGSGKSTLVHLILRFYDAGAGQVLVDGTDVREMSQAELRSRTGYVPQKAVLFSGTVADNIRAGDPSASDQAVEQAAAVAQATEFIEPMPDRWRSPVAQAGVNLSGGQKQRLALARAIVRRPGLYLLDDCFGALDFRTEARLREALRAWARDATVLVVAQRVSTVMDADQILVLDAGRVVDAGTHRELMRRCEVYREIVASQLPDEVTA